jgi:uncharacterized membrane protein YjjB (DUF3815 family)
MPLAAKKVFAKFPVLGFLGSHGINVVILLVTGTGMMAGISNMIAAVIVTLFIIGWGKRYHVTMIRTPKKFLFIKYYSMSLMSTHPKEK